MRLGGGMIALELKGGFEPAKKLMDYFASYTTPAELAVSLGSSVTYVQHPASMTHAGLSKEVREASGISDGLVRFSVGIENVADIIADLEHALNN